MHNVSRHLTVPMRLTLPNGQSAEVTHIMTAPDYPEISTKDDDVRISLEGVDRDGRDPKEVISHPGD